MNEKQKGLIIYLISYIITYLGGLLFYKYYAYDLFPKTFISENNELLLNIFISNVFSTIIIWLIGIYYNSASLYDPYWSVQTALIYIPLLYFKSRLNFGNILYISISLFWAFRLTINFIKSFSNITYIDWRYKIIKSKTGIIYKLINIQKF